MNRTLTLILACLLPVYITGCAEETILSAPDEAAYIEYAGEINALSKAYTVPRMLLGSAEHCLEAGKAADCNSNAPRIDNVGGFAGPLFGLATASGGKILVADAGAGVSILRGNTSATLLELPGVTGIGPIDFRAMWLSTGAGGDPGSDTGQAVYNYDEYGTLIWIANLFEFEVAHDPDGGEAPDSNPFDAAAIDYHDGLVVDAGGNDLLKVNTYGGVSALAVFPNELVSTANLQNLIGCPEPFIPDLAFICDVPMMPAEAVPTSVVIGPDGYYYVGELKGFPAPAGASNIWRVSPDASLAACGSSADCVKVFDGGFTSIIDLAFDKKGVLYVAEFDELSWFAVEVLGNGAGGSIKACNINTQQCREVASGIPMLTAITLGKDGSLWATKNALIPGQAEVFKVR